MSARVTFIPADIFIIRDFFLFLTNIGNQVSDKHPRSPVLQSSKHFSHLYTKPGFYCLPRKTRV